ncbi:MAG TPA: holo-ACP synthase [Alphaproteobacteria bacterium]
MMIIGLGTDIVQISRIKAMLDKFEERFQERCFTPAEISRASAKSNPAAAFARLYAAKEAALKALGTGMRESLAWHDFEVSHTLLGAPIMHFTGGAALILKEKGVETPKLHLSLSDDGDYAVATLIIET